MHKQLSTMACFKCNCSLRIIIMIIAAISAMQFIIETTVIVLVGEDYRLLASPDARHFYAIAGCQASMIVFSVILFVGAYLKMIWLCFPWLVLMVLNIIYHIYLIIQMGVKTVKNFDATKLEMMMLCMFFTMGLIYMTSKVINFIKDLRRGGSGDSQDEASFPLMGK